MIILSLHSINNCIISNYLILVLTNVKAVKFHTMNLSIYISHTEQEEIILQNFSCQYDTYVTSVPLRSGSGHWGQRKNVSYNWCHDLTKFSIYTSYQHLDKMANILQKTFWNIFYWMKSFDFQIKFHVKYLSKGLYLTTKPFWTNELSGLVMYALTAHN